MSIRDDFERMFHPKAVAVVGVSTSGQTMGGSRFVTSLQKAGFPGAIFPVNARGGEFSGLKCYTSIRELPQVPDLVVVSIPASAVPQLLEDCIATGVRNVHMFTAGFTETGDDERTQLEARIAQIARDGGINIIGPNCMGPYVPGSRLVMWGSTETKSGNVGFVSQSGALCERFTDVAASLGIPISKAISFGNGTMLESTDFLEYFRDDPETEMIGMYLEGVKNGPRFRQVISEINRKKPVILWKSGLTASGAKAAASHTGSLAGAETIWDAFYRQTGVIRANSVEEIAHVIAAFRMLPPSRGTGVAVIGGGGGNSVSFADVCAREGLYLPTFSEETRRGLSEFVPVAGTSVRNPLDAGLLQRSQADFEKAINLVAADPLVDHIIVHRQRPWEFDQQRPDEPDATFHYLANFLRTSPYRKPIVASIEFPEGDPVLAEQSAKLRQGLFGLGIPAYPSQVHAARALSRFVGYYKFLENGS